MCFMIGWFEKRSAGRDSLPIAGYAIRSSVLADRDVVQADAAVLALGAHAGRVPADLRLGRRAVDREREAGPLLEVVVGMFG